MTNTDLILTPDAAMITESALRLQYQNIRTLADIRDYFAAEMLIDIDPLDRDDLASAIDTDLADMIHNCNLDFYADQCYLDELTDDQTDALADHLREHFDATMIADCLLDRLHFTDN